MRKILVFGATSAIVMDTLRPFADSGDSFFLVARSAEKLESIKGDLISRGAKLVECEVSDLADTALHQELIKKAFEKFSRFDVAILGYGTLGDQKKCEASFAETLKELNSNFLSVVSILTDLANRFEAQGDGTLAVIGSVAGDRGRQSNYVYGTAKGATELFLEGLRNRLYSKGVHVLTVKPGFVDTPMTQGFKKGPLFADSRSVGRTIHKAILARCDVLYVPWFWFVIMSAIRCIPERIFKRMKL